MNDNIDETEFLLGRQQIDISDEYITKSISGKTIMVTGGGGSIGSELCRQIVKCHPERLMIVDMNEGGIYNIQNELCEECSDVDINTYVASVCDEDRMNSIFDRINPDMVFHAAAYKHVPLMECNPGEAVKNNILGTYNIALVSRAHKTGRFILISTDKAVNPTSVMGATKCFCEKLVQSLNGISDTRFLTVRFGNVLGSSGSVVPLFKSQIEKGGPVKVTHPEIERFFMSVPEAAQLVIRVACYGQEDGVYVLDMGNPVKIYNVAEKLIRMYGYEPGRDIRIEITDLRLGEKLNEELFAGEAKRLDSELDKIYLEKQVPVSFETINKNVNMLTSVLKNGSDDDILHAIRKVVPSYRCRI